MVLVDSLKEGLVLRQFLLLLILSVTILVTGCTSKDDIGIKGEVKEVFKDDYDITGIYVEGEVEEDTLYDKADVSFTEKTKVYKEDNKVDFNELREGHVVEVIFNGEVAESYPVQGKAKKVKIIE